MTNSSAWASQPKVEKTFAVWGWSEKYQEFRRALYAPDLIETDQFF